jgi:hypothetical protein
VLLPNCTQGLARSLVARALPGAAVVISGAHASLLEAIASTLPALLAAVSHPFRPRPLNQGARAADIRLVGTVITTQNDKGTETRCYTRIEVLAKAKTVLPPSTEPKITTTSTITASP